MHLTDIRYGIELTDKVPAADKTEILKLLLEKRLTDSGAIKLYTYRTRVFLFSSSSWLA